MPASGLLIVSVLGPTVNDPAVRVRTLETVTFAARVTPGGSLATRLKNVIGDGPPIDWPAEPLRVTVLVPAVNVPLSVMSPATETALPFNRSVPAIARLPPIDEPVVGRRGRERARADGQVVADRHRRRRASSSRRWPMTS